MRCDRLSTPQAKTILILALALCLQGCANLRPDHDTPTVTVNSFRVVPSQTLMPNFEIGLRVLNPNSTALALRGIAWSISLDGNRLIQGADNNLPVIDAYSQADVTVLASANMFAGARFVAELLQQPRDRVAYTFEAKLDTGALWPAIRIRDTRDISLRAQPNGQ